MGLSWMSDKGEVRLGSARWCGLDEVDQTKQSTTSQALETEVWLTRPGKEPARFAFAPQLRPDTPTVIAKLKDKGFGIAIMSGDRARFVEPLARQLGIDAWQGDMTPADKIEAIDAMKADGKMILMVGDGLNDTPALAAAHASLAPTSAADISRRAADTVFQGASLKSLPSMIDTAKRARTIVIQNLTFSVLYNLFWVPVAIAGLVTPWIAAIAMAASSIIVTINALRLDGLKPLSRLSKQKEVPTPPLAPSIRSTA
jgi:Cu2+-exporting ATPase